MKKIFILLSVLCITFYNCVDVFDAKLGDDGIGTLVVNGNIISDSTVVFSLSSTFSLDKEYESGYSVYGDVCVIGSDGSRFRGEYINNGEHLVSIGTLKKEVAYSLEIRYGGDLYLSAPQYPLESTEITELTFEQPEEYGDIHVTVSASDQNATEPLYLLWTYEEDWEVRTVYYSNWMYEPEIDQVTYFEKAPYAQGWNRDQVHETLVGSTEKNKESKLEKRLYSIASDDLRVSYYYSVLLKQRNLTKGEFEYYQSKAKQSTEMGGLFTPQPSELPTNITCSNPDRKAIGYIGVNMNVSQRRMYISTDDIQYTNKLICSSYSEKTLMLNMPKGRSAFYSNGYRICCETESVYYWAPKKCVDCRELGGIYPKPSFWPLPDRTY